MKRTRLLIALLGVPALVIVAALLYNFPPVHERLAWRIDTWKASVKYALNPPDQAIFQPTEQARLEEIVQATMQAFEMNLTPTSTATPLPPAEMTSTATITPTPLPPTVTPTPLPEAVSLSGVKYEDQHNRWNYCGPANFSMALNFWGWEGNRDVIGKVIKPSDKDKNVMPYEFQNYIAENVPWLGSQIRMGGDINVIKRLVAAGFPVIAEKGYYERDYTGKIGWMGHYQFITGYVENENGGELIIQDTYLDGPDFHVPYEKFIEGWRSFNYVFIVVYPWEREADVIAALGPWADAAWAARHALEVAQAESEALSGIDQFFAWFNIGTSHVNLQEYADAAIAYDYAFSLYAALDADNTTRPYRMLWYQSWPYWAYFYTGRYFDVINLANTTLEDTISEPVLEESLYWRGRAKYMLGDTPGAIEDYRAALNVHPDWAPAVQALLDLGAQP